MLVAFKLLMTVAWLCIQGSPGTASAPHSPGIRGSSFAAIATSISTYPSSLWANCTYDTDLRGTMPQSSVMIGWASLLGGLRVRRRRKLRKTVESKSQSCFAYDYDAPASIHSHHAAPTHHRPKTLQTHNCGAHRLYYYGYRYYLPESGRWINRDPIGDVAFYPRGDSFEKGSKLKRDLDLKRAKYEFVLHFAMSKASKYPAYAELIPLILGELDLMNQQQDLMRMTVRALYLFVNNDAANGVDLLGLWGGCVSVSPHCKLCVGTPCSSAPLPPYPNDPQQPPPEQDPCKIMPPAPPPPSGDGGACIICS